MSQSVLSFLIDKTTCAVPITSVLEVLNYTEATTLPGSESFVEGLIYSREQGVTVVNLRQRFGLHSAKITKNSRIIVIEKKNSITTEANSSESESAESQESSVSSLFGAVVDNVNDVIEISDENICKKQKKKPIIPASYIKDIYKIDENIIYLLDVDKLFENIQILTEEK